jgi:hypothetical protein
VLVACVPNYIKKCFFFFFFFGFLHVDPILLLIFLLLKCSKFFETN